MSKTNTPSRYRWELLPNVESMEKSDIVANYVNYMLMRTSEMFEITGAPETMPQEKIKLIVQTHGSGTVAEVGGNLYIFAAGLGGRPNAYYEPTQAIIANPGLNYNATLEIGKDCVVIKNDLTYTGLMPLFYKYANLLAECDLSIRMATVLTRVPTLATADNSNTVASFERFFSDIEAGKFSGLILDRTLLDGLKTNDYASKISHLKDLIETRQYLLANWFIELGLNANYNMKREALNSSETAINEQTLTPLIEQMYNELKKGIEKVNEKYGTSMTVEKGKAWKEYTEEKGSAYDESFGAD